MRNAFHQTLGALAWAIVTLTAFISIPLTTTTGYMTFAAVSVGTLFLVMLVLQIRMHAAPIETALPRRYVPFVVVDDSGVTEENAA